MTSTLPPLVQATSGALAGAAANGFSYPLDLVATKVQTSRSKRQSHGLVAAYRIIRNVVETRGIGGLYSGLETDTGATLLSSFFYFYCYSLLRNGLLRHKSKSRPNTKNVLPTAWEELILGYIAGVASRLASTPLNLVTIRLQDEKDKPESDDIEKGKGKGKMKDGSAVSEHHDQPNGVLKVFQELYAEGGLAGFWRGFSLTLLTSSNPALTYAFTSIFLRTFLGSSRTTAQRSPSALMNFFAGAIGNSLAVCIIYPLILAKTRVSASAKRITIRKVIQEAIDNDGFLGLYQGLLVQVIKGFFTQGITLLTKQRIETRFVALYKIVQQRKIAKGSL
ncbi:hypothetical protein M422DRAFT_776629 [Sphaerobolus stellatus SS14]|nr:hypothetical protein M422DRAFT_776629 [Sphaerobolus stellatus SS14]